jgi:hypothetical protein
LHRDDTELVLFVDPDEESLLLVVEDTSAVGPVVVEANSLKETISLPKLKLEKFVSFEKMLERLLT